MAADSNGANDEKGIFHFCGLDIGGRYTIAQFEIEIRAECQMDGVKKAKDQGVQFRTKPKLTDAQITELRQRRQNGELIRDLLADYGISKATIYRYLNLTS